MTPFYDLTEMEQLGQTETPFSSLRSGILVEEFGRLQGRKILQHAALGRAPRVRFKDLETMVDTKLSYNLFPFEFRTDYFRITDDTVMAAVTIKMQNRNMTFESSDGVQKATVNIFWEDHDPYRSPGAHLRAGRESISARVLIQVDTGKSFHVSNVGALAQRSV